MKELNTKHYSGAESNSTLLKAVNLSSGRKATTKRFRKISFNMMPNQGISTAVLTWSRALYATLRRWRCKKKSTMDQVSFLQFVGKRKLQRKEV
jgi:hypothetical protein